MQMMTRYLRQIEPLVQHGLRELQQGASVEHTMREVALMASLVGGGITPTRAIAQVEQAEATLLGPSPAAEYAGTTGYGVPTTYGKQMPTMYGKQAPMTYGKQMPTMYGKQAPVMYGQQMPQTWMGY